MLARHAQGLQSLQLTWQPVVLRRPRDGHPDLSGRWTPSGAKNRFYVELEGKKQISAGNLSVAVILMALSLGRAAHALPCPPRLGRDYCGSHWHPDGDQAGMLLTTHNCAAGLFWGWQQEGSSGSKLQVIKSNQGEVALGIGGDIAKCVCVCVRGCLQNGS